MADVKILPPAARYLKKLKDQKLKKLYEEAIRAIMENPELGDAKKGDLNGVRSYDIYHNRINYELAYTVEYVDDAVIVIIMAGTRENFYEQLKRYWN
ncbi:MAG: type II toxin-antitoxin system RelE/ParE family toxin [Erysipelotrichaceae bacterium]|nr:type II toxin-antitoxin system RelE/ParE family toxin [Erysipelotrichaceae bacterium]